MHEQIKELEILQARINEAIKQLDIVSKQRAVSDMEDTMNKPGFWDDQARAADISKKHADLKKQVEEWLRLESDIKAILEIARLDDHSLLKDIKTQYQEVKESFEAKEFELKLSGEYDHGSAILHLHAGTGGTDAQDWAQMLERMYLRYAERHGLNAEVVSESAGEEAGIKSAILRIEGAFAFGRLKGEHGVHRLVRQSPFNADSLRQTSFALIEVTPDMPQTEQVIIDEKDLQIDTYRSSGRGGQSVNTTDSAVRIKHVPTGIVVAIQNERSQLKNKETAMKILNSRLLSLLQEQRAEKIEELKGPTHTEQWGKQIRNYVLHPYTLVKDTRTGFETKDVTKVLDGDLDDFIDAYLTSQIGKDHQTSVS